MTQYEYADQHLKISFPDDMTVLTSAQSADDELLSQYALTREDLTSTFENGCVYYGMGTDGTVQRRVTVTVEESDYSKEIWQLKESEPETVQQFTDDIIEFFNTSGQQLNAAGENGYHVLNKGAFSQGGAYCVFVDVAPYGSEEYDSIYMATIINGKWYGVLYNTSQPITEQTEQEAHEIFNSFYITKTLSPNSGSSKNSSGTTALLVVLMAAIFITVTVLVVRIFVPARPKEDEGPYVAQFEDTLELNRTKNKKDK